MKSMTIKGIPDDVLRRFRMFCLHNDLTVKAAIIQIMKEKGDSYEYQQKGKPKP